ncbi:MAG TPA: trypsin-like peptidase domain-containing protein [Nocardioidaceae bacterium]|nr:trypsin-like peptidase domain-containing protein [Nocardioidaceae bacterium]
MPVVVLAFLLGLGGGAGGAYLVVQTNRPGPTAPAAAAPTISTAKLPSGAGSPVVAVARRVLPSVVSIDVRGDGADVSGSGFVYDAAGNVVTNNHVVENAANGGQIMVSLAGGKDIPATIVGRSPSYDLAVVRLRNPGPLTPATLGRSANVQVGQSVVAFGSPLGLNATVTAGIISALNRPVKAGGEGEISFINALQTDAAINPGNSGGPLVDLAGRVIGVNSAIATLGQSTQESGNIGVGFAIPIDQVVRTVRQIIRTGHAVYPVIGAQVSISGGGGARILEVTPGGPAQRAGLRGGDVVTRVGPTPVADGVQLIVAVRSHQPGDRVALSYLRDGHRAEATVTLGSQVG